MIKNMCMIKFDILANKGMGYNKGKIEKKFNDSTCFVLRKSYLTFELQYK